jgi:hypothetical protein
MSIHTKSPVKLSHYGTKLHELPTHFNILKLYILPAEGIYVVLTINSINRLDFVAET